MIVSYCPACATKAYRKGVADGQCPVSFEHYEHEITVEKEEDK